LNDLAAVAYGVPLLEAGDLRPVGPLGGIGPAGTVAVLGSGTGFGTAALVRDGLSETVLSGEGGHTTLAAATELDLEICRTLAKTFGRVSVERVLSAPGLLNLHRAIAVIDGGESAYPTPEAIVEAVKSGAPDAVKAAQTFCTILGAVAGDLALAYGAIGGVLIGGHVVDALLPANAASFRARFEAKGRMKGYVERIPTALIQRPEPALLGAARAALDA
jgi:glucokinase